MPLKQNNTLSEVDVLSKLELYNENTWFIAHISENYVCIVSQSFHFGCVIVHILCTTCKGLWEIYAFSPLYNLVKSV